MSEQRSLGQMTRVRPPFRKALAGHNAPFDVQSDTIARTFFSVLPIEFKSRHNHIPLVMFVPAEAERFINSYLLHQLNGTSMFKSSLPVNASYGRGKLPLCLALGGGVLSLGHLAGPSRKQDVGPDKCLV